MGQYLLGIDNGGTMTKAAIFELNGKEVAVASQKTPVIIPKVGYAERDMLALWDANANVIKEAIKKSKIDSKEIVGIGCTGHGKGLYLWGKDHKPAYNAIASTDFRAVDLIKTWKENGVSEQARQKTLQYPIACQPVALLAWLKENKLDIYNNIKWIFEAKDFTRFMLTGEAYAEITDYSGTCLMNLLTGQFDSELLKLFGIEEVFDCLPPLKNSYELCGYVTKDAAEKTGLTEGTPVCGGMFDIDACAISMDVSDEVYLCVITGTWSINEYISKEPIKGALTTLNSFFCIPGYYLIEESSPTSAGNLEWYIDNFMEANTMTAKQNGVSVYQEIDKMVSSVSPFETNILFVPFLYGTNDSKLDSSVFFGLNVSHQKAHMLRAIFEGVVFSHMIHIEKLLMTRENPQVIRLAGGAANSNVWVQMFADTLGIPVEVVSIKELGTLGCAMAASIGAGIYTDYKDAASHMVKIEKRIQPNQENNKIYRKKYEKYKKLIEVLGNAEL